LQEKEKKKEQEAKGAHFTTMRYKQKPQKKEKDSKMRLYTCKKTRENQKHEVKFEELRE
jgi:hypothetical protein